MSNVLVEKNKLDVLANAISNKSGEPLKLTLDEMVEAVDGIELGIQPSGNINITQAGRTDVTNYETATVPQTSANLSVEDGGFFSSNGRWWRVRGKQIIENAGWIGNGTSTTGYQYYNAVPSGTTITPSTSTQRIGGAKYMMEGAVTVEAVPQAFGAGGDIDITYFDDKGQRWARLSPWTYYQFGYVDGETDGVPINVNAIPTGTTVTPTESAQTIGGADTMMEGAVTVSAIPSNYVGSGITQRSSTDLTVSGATVTAPSGYYSANASKSVASGNQGAPSWSTSKGAATFTVAVSYPNATEGYYRSIDTGSYSMLLENKTVTPSTSQQVIEPKSNVHYLNSVTVDAMPSGTAGTPTATKGTVSNHSVSVTPSVTNTTGYITGGTKSGTAVSVSASELVSGTLNVTSAGTKDVTNYASASIPSGTEGTPTATKGTVSNHSVSVTPSVTNTNGFISGGTRTGTAVTVSASELVSGSETKTQNGTYDVTNLAEIVVDVQGGGSSGVQVAVATPQSGANSTVVFGELMGTPTSFSLINTYDIAIGTDPIVSALTYDGTDYVGQTVTNTSNANASYVSAGFSHQCQYGQIVISSENAIFDTYSNYVLVYTYGGSASDIHTSDVQVGSGATSITFPVSGRPTYWSCVFKSNFGTSSGYQRVIAVANDGTNTFGTYGLCLDSSVHASNTYWTASYSGGNFTISSQSTNAGGYFHQPGYYQLTYIVDESAPSYQTKTVTPTTSQQVVSPDSGFDALSQVTVNAIPSQYIIPSGNLAITENGNNINVSQYATVSVNVSGGGGSSTCDTKTVTNSNDQATSIEFTGLSGQPKWFFVRCTTQLSRSSSYSYYYITAVRYNGTNHYGNYYRRSNGTFYNDTTHYSHTYSNGTLTVSSSANRGAAGGSFYNGTYELVYIY